MTERDQKKSLPGDGYGVVVLAAGASKRMGSLKGLLKWGERSVLEQVYNVWREAGAVQVAVVYDPEHERMIAEMDRLGVAARIANTEAEFGMMSSLCAASGWDGWRTELRGVVVALIDQPQVTVEMARALMAFAQLPGNAVSICQPKHGDKRGHPVVMPWGEFRAIQNAEVRSLREFIHRRADRRRFMEISDESLLQDMDTPEAYEQMTAKWVMVRD